jgi:hypothetical protein
MRDQAGTASPRPANRNGAVFPFIVVRVALMIMVAETGR